MSSTRLTIDSQNEGANTSLLNKAVFLDRDGILNHAIVRNGRPYAPTRLSEFKLIEGVSDCLIRLKSARFLTVVVTNQPDVSRGQITRKELAAMHEKLSRELALDDIFVCECTNECLVTNHNQACLLKQQKSGQSIFPIVILLAIVGVTSGQVFMPDAKRYLLTTAIMKPHPLFQQKQFVLQRQL